MRPNELDLGFLWDIEDACTDILLFLKGTNYDDFADDKMKRFAVERQLLVVGEAAYHVSESCRNENPDIPWKQMIGLRNIIAHEYGEILVDRIYKIAKENVPDLKRSVSRLLKA